MSSRLDKLVQKYLLSKGLNDAAKLMEEQLSKTGSAVATNDEGVEDLKGAASPTTSSDLFSVDLIVDGIHGGKPSVYTASYERYREWACGSLDIVKQELASLCLPLFAHSYIGLIRRRQCEAARAFWEQASRGAPDLRLLYTEEIEALGLLTDVDQLSNESFLAECHFIRCVSASRFKVRLSKLAYQLLMQFLLNDDDITVSLIAAILNATVDIDAVTFSPADIATAINEASGGHEVLSVRNGIISLPGFSLASGEISTRQLPPVNLSIPGQFMHQLGAGGSAVRMDAHTVQKVSKLGVPRAFLAGAEDMTPAGKKAIGANSVANTQGPLPSAKDASAIFATVTNTYDGLICLHMDKSVSQMAAGFADSVVRVWRLDGHPSNENLKKRARGWGGGWIDMSESSGLASLLADHDCFYGTILPNMESRGSAPGTSLTRLDITDREKGDIPAPPRVANKSRPYSQPYPCLELTGHSKPVFGVCQDDSTRLVLSCAGDKSMRLWDLCLAQCVNRLRCTTDQWTVAFGPLGYHFASGGRDGTVAVYATDRSCPLRLMSGHVSDAISVCWHPNAALVFSGSDDRTTRLWDIRSAVCARVCTGAPCPVTCVSVCPDGRIAAGGLENGAVLLWDLSLGLTLGVLRPSTQAGAARETHGAAVHCVGFSADGKKVVAGCDDSAVRIWDVSKSLTAAGTSFSVPVSINPSGGSSSTAAKKSELAATSSASSSVTSGTNSINLTRVRVPLTVPSLCPDRVFHTKATPVYFVGYTTRNLLFAGGPFTPRPL